MIHASSRLDDSNRGNDSVAESKVGDPVVVDRSSHPIPRFMQSVRVNTAREKKTFLSNIAQLHVDGFDRRPVGNPTSVYLSNLGQLQYLPEHWKEISSEDLRAMKSIHTDYDSALLEAQHYRSLYLWILI